MGKLASAGAVRRARAAHRKRTGGSDALSFGITAALYLNAAAPSFNETPESSSAPTLILRSNTCDLNCEEIKLSLVKEKPRQLRSVTRTRRRGDSNLSTSALTDVKEDR
ncbi:hypothetical protein JOB18_023861 [Solea senegalensis]|uniref:Uncharacterized protein n=1 Tax=Solea senegalensis TaxID=28829 RepID=A0AAV6SMU2_SOLSE|nr:hypothetical protein JOB18_023861 [Solea senegalensis]